MFSADQSSNGMMVLYVTDKLDGISLNKWKHHETQSLEDFMQLPDDYNTRHSLPGQKRVGTLTLHIHLKKKKKILFIFKSFIITLVFDTLSMVTS